MQADHQAVIDQAVALVTKLGVTPKDNDVSKKLMSDSEATIKTMKTKSGKAFDKAYVDNEVAYHKAVISTVENVLIPQAQNAELKSLLQKVLPTLKTHLEHAEMVQKAM
jgi:putative membrane protein